jgi:hypothetical protein
LARFASVPVTSIKLRLDWASATVAPPVSDMATTAMAKAFLIVELRKLLFPRQRLNLPHPRLRQRNARAAVPSFDRFHV